LADTGENKNKDRAEHVKPQLRLGLKPNINQFLLLILVNAFVGAMIGLEQTVVPLLGKEEFGLESNVLILSFIASFGIVNGATTLGDKSFSPNHTKVKVGSSIIWTNDDSIIHTVTSGTPNTPDAGQVFDSGLTSLVSPSKTYSHKFISAGEFSYFCRLHPTMVGEIEVVQ
jgi:plastocyanin